MSHTTLQHDRSPGAFWTLRREASLNWLAARLAAGSLECVRQ